MATSFLQVKNNASGVLLSDLAPATSAATLAAGQGASFPSTGTFHVTIDSEILQVTSRASDILTLGTRGAESTTAASHLANADVRLNITARHLTDVGTAINTLENLTHNSGSYVAQDLFYASGTAQTARLAVGGTGNYLGVSAAGTLSYSNPGGAAWKPDQACVGTVNGTNTVYVVPDAVYIANSLQVSLNGQLLTHGSDFAETTPTGGTFTMAEAPAIGAIVRANYLISQTPSANADTVDGYHASSTPGASTILPLNASGKFPASVMSSGGLWVMKSTPYTNILSLSSVSTTGDTDIDLTANTSPTATFVMLKGTLDNSNTSEGSFITLRAKGATSDDTYRVVLRAPQVNGFHQDYPCIIVAMDSEQRITYAINSNASATSVNLYVIGYFEPTA